MSRPLLEAPTVLVCKTNEERAGSAHVTSCSPQWLMPLALALIGCSTETDASEESPAQDIVQSDLVDIDPDPDVVEVRLAAAEGTAAYLKDGPAKIWGYRDNSLASSRASVPGPRLELQQGQTVVVHFTNELPEGTTIHWHGLRVPNASDGTPSVQVEVAPGQSYDYSFTAHDAGTFWYHPHVRSDEQIERGLYGVVRVHGGASIPVHADRTFVLDDVKLEASGLLSTNTVPLDVMLGRQGNVILANGKRAGQITSRSGARERWRFVNTANGRYFNLRLPRHPWRVIGWDGGLLSEPYEAGSLIIAPGERYEVLVVIDDPAGSVLTVQTLHYDRGHNIPDPGPLPVFSVAVDGSAAKIESLPTAWGAPVDLTVPLNAAERNIELSEEDNAESAFPSFFVNGKAFPDVPAIQARSGDIEIWRVQNDSEMDHPFHLHGHFFRVTDVDGSAPLHDGWKDTVNVPRKQVLRFAVRYGEPGTWMYHCHILEHAERGMMGELQLAANQ
jgi:FtsP/CotA-like multicopper oxidase with cupredoxin domain